MREKTDAIDYRYSAKKLKMYYAGHIARRGGGDMWIKNEIGR